VRRDDNFPVPTEILNDCVSSNQEMIDNPEMTVPTLNGDLADPGADDEILPDPRD
jgi:hypothetical protein